MSSHIIEAKDGSTFAATTDHAWETPRGEVYLVAKEGDGEDDAEVCFPLTPKQARDLAVALTGLAAKAQRKPAATHDIWGDRIDSEEESA